MKKLGFLLFAVALVIGLVFANIFSFGSVRGLIKSSFGGVQGSGNIIREKRDVKGFEKVNVGGGFQVEIVAGKEFGVEVEADDNLMPLVTTDVDGDTLEIGRQKGFSAKSPLRIRITAPNISGIDTSGGAGVTISEVKNSEIRIESSGGSRVTASGTTAKLSVEMSGGAKVVASDLAAADVNVEGSGGSSVDVLVSGELRSDISGGARVTYSGSPTSIVTNKTGGARVVQK